MERIKTLLLKFQLLLKGCTIEAIFNAKKSAAVEFQLLLKGCTIEACLAACGPMNVTAVSVVVERMYD